ncbi:hypothetical protein Leryth_001928 [Lithospermum erythrorhizon]|nr:hypothetical protein Leryth_001928 [Lithospermum erythrorhizon]
MRVFANPNSFPKSSSSRNRLSQDYLDGIAKPNSFGKSSASRNSLSEYSLDWMANPLQESTQSQDNRKFPEIGAMKVVCAFVQVMI